MPSQSVDVTLLGQKITLKTSVDSTQAKQVADLVSSRLTHAESRFKGGMPSAHLVALLALFELAEEYLAAQGRVEEHQALLQAKLKELSV